LGIHGANALQRPPHAANLDDGPDERMEHIAEGGRTLAFCTCYAADATTWQLRYRRWIRAMQRNGLAWDQLLIVDDGSPALPEGWNDVAVVRAGEAAPADARIVLVHFARQLGQGGWRDYPGWFRSFGFAADYAAARGFARVVHVESDAYVISRRFAERLNAVREGWVAPLQTRHRMPESAIQVIAGASLGTFRDFAALSYDPFRGKDIEREIPFTEVLTGFKGDRYGEFQDFVPMDADFSVQVHPPSWGDAAYFWWIEGGASRTVRPMTLLPPLPESEVTLGAASHAAATAPRLRVLAHVSGIGDVRSAVDDVAGDAAADAFIEGFALEPLETLFPREIEYRAVLADGTETPPCTGGALCGARGQSLRIEGFAVRTLGALARTHEAEYAGEFADGTRAGPVRQGAVCRGPGAAALKRMQVRVVPRARAAFPASERPARPEAAPPETFEADFAEGGNSAEVLGGGVAGQEKEKLFRWSEGTECQFRLPRPARPGRYRLSIAGRPFLAPPRLAEQRFRLDVNGTRVGEASLGLPAETQVLRAELPWSLLAGEPVVLVRVGLPDAARPADVTPPSQDQRLLGFAFERITLTGPLDAPAESGEAAGEVAARPEPARVRDLLLRCEGLGGGLAFGLAQRACGAEPLDLLRFSETKLPVLLAALHARFARLGEGDTLTLEEAPGPGGTVVCDARYGIRLRTWLRPGDGTADDILERERRRLPLLAHQLVDDLTEGARLFVWHDAAGEGLDGARSLAAALRRYGPGVLLWAAPGGAPPPDGTVERAEAGLLLGRIDTEATEETWADLCRNALRVAWR
jgi:hypothetical protein